MTNYLFYIKDVHIVSNICGIGASETSKLLYNAKVFERNALAINTSFPKTILMHVTFD